MTGTITLTASMRANLLSLQQTGANLATTQLALSTGNKVNSALDNPVNYFAAQSLNQRASSLSALLDGMGQAVQTIQAANQGITSITTLVNQLSSVANTAQQNIAKVTTQNVLETAGASGLDSLSVADLVTGTSAITAGGAFSLQDGTAPAVSFTIDTTANGGVGTTLQSVADAINKVSGFSASVVYGDGVTTSAAGGTTVVGNAYLSITSTDGKAITATDIGGSGVLAALGLGGASAATPSVTTAADNTSFQNVLAQINALATDSNYQGNKLIAGTGANLTVQVNELSSNAITVNSVDSTTTGLGLAGKAVDTAGNITTAIAAIKAALSTLQGQASGFANTLSMLQARQDFTTNLVNTLQNGASQLTIADKNEEGANLLALQTQQQLGIEALSLSSQANQSVLRLFS